MFDSHYINWRDTRINTTIKLLGENFLKNKKILELGCGYGHISDYLVKKYNCENITASDGRQQHVLEMEKKQSKGEMARQISLLVHDCEQNWNPNNGKFDLIIHWGLLYHLKDIKEHLSDILKYTKYMLLETEVCDSDQPVNHIIDENGYDQALNGKGCRPSPIYVENILTENEFHFKRVDDPDLNSGFHVYNWISKNDNKHRVGLRRYWIVWKKDIEAPIINY